MKLRKRIAFTIIEILTVLAILGTLIAIGVNEYTTSINTTRTITFRENVDAIVDCLNVHFSINHRYPDSLEEIRGCLNKTPINPFTGEDMLTDGSITYTPLNDGLEYIIVVHQPDVDDHDGDGDTDEPIIEPPTMLSENIHIIIHPSGAGTAKARPNPADSGVVVFLTSKAGQCYNFNSWQPISDITINNPLSPNATFTMIGDEVSIISKFDIKRYQVVLTSPGGEEVLGAGEYNCGEQVTVQAIPLTGHYFVGWYSGNTLVSASPYYTFRIYSDVSLEARSAYYITLYANPATGGDPTVSPNPAAYKTTVTLSANPDICYNFSGWTSPDVTVTGNTFIMPAKNVSITSNYTIKQYQITVNITKTGNSPNTPGTVSGAGTYNCGSTATLVATPTEGFSFAGWYEGTAQASTSATYSFTVNSTRTLEARFNAILYNITLTASPAGAGSQSASPNPAYVGQTVTLTATPNSCYDFSSWTLPGVTVTGSTFVMPAKNVSVTANYTVKKYPIAVNITKTGNSPPYTPGTVTGTGIYNCGSTATLVATPTEGFSFAGWYEGTAQASTSATYSFTVTGTRTLEARFKPDIVITFIRNSVAYPDDEQTEYVSDYFRAYINVPRYRQGKFGQGIFIEEGTTNLLSANQSSVEFDLSGLAGSARIIRDTSTAWEGNASAKATGSIPFYITTYPKYVPTYSNNVYTVSVHAKSSATQNQVFAIKWVCGGLVGSPTYSTSATTVTLTTSWQKFTVTGVAPYSPYGWCSAWVELHGGANTTIWWDAAQFEEKPYATSWTNTARDPEELNISPVSKLFTTQQGTIEVWVKVPESWQTGITNTRRIWTIGSTQSAGTYWLGYDLTTDKIKFEIYNDNSVPNTISVAKPSTGWHRFAAAWSPTKMALYIDDHEVGSIPNPSLPTSFADTQLLIGHRATLPSDPVNERVFDNINTVIDDLRISNIARTLQEIQERYNSNQPAPKDANTTLKLNFDGNLNPQ